jgi:hypothetical protein
MALPEPAQEEGEGLVQVLEEEETGEEEECFEFRMEKV